MNNSLSDKVFDNIFSRVEFADVEDGLRNNQHVAFEFSPLCGESLFAESLRKRLDGDEFIVFYIDLRMVTDRWHFAINYCRALVDGMDDPGRKAGMLKRLAMGGRLSIDRSPGGNFDYDIPAKSEVPKILSTLLDIPEVTAIEENKRSIVIMSGFDCMPGILGKPGLKSFNEKVSRQAITSYVIIGTGIIQKVSKLGGRISSQVKEYMASDLFTNEKLIGFLRESFREESVSLSEEVAKSLVDVADGRMELVLRLAERLLERSQKDGSAGMESVEVVLDGIVDSAAPAYNALWNQHNSRQKSLLFGLSADRGKSIYSEYFINRYGFGTATNLQAALRGLTAKSIIIKRGKKWDFADPFFREWIKGTLALHPASAAGGDSSISPPGDSAGDAIADEKPIGETSTGEAPADETPADEKSIDESSIDESIDSQGRE
jgi:hypothetical protein